MNATPPPTTAQVDDGRHLADERLVDLALGERLSQPEHDHLDSCPACHDEARGHDAHGHRDEGRRHGRASPSPDRPSGRASPTRLAAPDTDEPDAPDMDEPDAARDVVPAPLKVGPAPDVAVLPAPTTSSGSPRSSCHWTARVSRLGARAVGLGPGSGGWRQPASPVCCWVPAGSSRPTVSVTTRPPRWRPGRSRPPRLDTLDTAQQRGTATVSERADSVTLDVAARDLQPTDGGYVEVWLINRDLKRMVSVGVLDDGVADQSFPISRRLLDEGYVIVDLSREQFDDQPQHSGDSLVRGALTSRA